MIMWFTRTRVLLVVIHIIVRCSFATMPSYPHDELECQLVKSSKGVFYFVLQGEKLQIDDDKTLEALFFSTGDALTNVPDVVLDSIKSGDHVNSDWHHEDETKFYNVANDIHNCKSLRKRRYTLIVCALALSFDNKLYFSSSFLNLTLTLHRTELSKMSTLLVMVDNRPLDASVTYEASGYFQLNALINFQYAKRHNYDFIILRMNSTNLVEDVEKDYQISANEISEEMKKSSSSKEDATKNSITLFNPAIKQFRSSPWSKLPSLIFILDMLGLDQRDAPPPRLKQYDVVFFLDSDASFTPRLQNRTIGDFLGYWGKRHEIASCLLGNGKVLFEDGGSPNCGVHINNASMVFFSNAMAASYPCSVRIFTTLTPFRVLTCVLCAVCCVLCEMTIMTLHYIIS